MDERYIKSAYTATAGGGGGIGRRNGLKIHRPQGLEGSIPSRPTFLYGTLPRHFFPFMIPCPVIVAQDVILLLNPVFSQADA